MLISSDIIEHLLKNFKTLMCHRSGDVAMEKWIQDMVKTKKIHRFPDNNRIVHHPTVATRIDSFIEREEICHSFISMHGVYGNETYILDKILQKEKMSMSPNYTIPPIVDSCPKTFFRWENFIGYWRSAPALCSTFPLWSNFTTYHGRTGGKYR